MERFMKHVIPIPLNIPTCDRLITALKEELSLSFPRNCIFSVLEAFESQLKVMH